MRNFFRSSLDEKEVLQKEGLFLNVCGKRKDSQSLTAEEKTLTQWHCRKRGWVFNSNLSLGC